MATRSAHTVRPYVPFSTLQPPQIRPCASSIAAPTAKPLRPATAWLRACVAASIRRSRARERPSSRPVPPASGPTLVRSSDEPFPDPLRRFENLVVAERLADDPRRHVSDHEMPMTRTPMCCSAIASGTVDMPTASAPSLRNARISAGVS